MPPEPPAEPVPPDDPDPPEEPPLLPLPPVIRASTACIGPPMLMKSVKSMSPMIEKSMPKAFASFSAVWSTVVSISTWAGRVSISLRIFSISPRFSG